MLDVGKSKNYVNCFKWGNSDSEGDILETSKFRLKEGEVVRVHVWTASKAAEV
jgi:hypothetical protein